MVALMFGLLVEGHIILLLLLYTLLIRASAVASLPIILHLASIIINNVPRVLCGFVFGNGRHWHL